MSPNTPAPLLKHAELATFLGISPSTIYEYQVRYPKGHPHAFPVEQIGLAPRYDPAAVRSWFAAESEGFPELTKGQGGALVESELRHYTPEQVTESQWLPISARTLREMAYARKIPHSNNGRRISFTLQHIRTISAMFTVEPLTLPRHSPGRRRG